MKDTKSLEKIKTLQKELETNIVEREAEIEGSLAALISKMHVLFLGPPGTAKSLLAENICKAIVGGKFFRWLMTKYTTPEEIFGPTSLKGLENDEYRRIVKNKLPEAVIAFLDEVWKSNSAILNSMLTAINERKFDNNGDKAMDIPLLSCFGASNELPEGEMLSALYDRFMMRYWVKEIQEEKNFFALITGAIGNTPPTTTITIDDINELHKQLDSIEMPADIVTTIRKIQNDLQLKGITASPRRWKSAATVLKAFALLRGLDEVTRDELETFADMMWHKPEDRRTILEVVGKYGNPLNVKAIDYLDMAKEVYDKWQFADVDSKELAAVQAHKQIQDIIKDIKKDVYGRPNSETKRLRETQRTIKGWMKTLAMKMMGIDEDDAATVDTDIDDEMPF